MLRLQLYDCLVTMFCVLSSYLYGSSTVLLIFILFYSRRSLVILDGGYTLWKRCGADADRETKAMNHSCARFHLILSATWGGWTCSRPFDCLFWRIFSWLVCPTDQIPDTVCLNEVVVHLPGVVSEHLQTVVYLLKHYILMIELRLSHIEESLPHMLQLHL